MSLYLWIIAGSISGPLLLSFDKKVRFFSYWKALLPAIIAVAIGFLCWDEYFARLGVWGFTSTHVTGIYFGKLPLEECLFFLIVPYACVFVYEVIKAYFPKRKTAVFARLFAFLMVFSGMYLGTVYLDNWYTSSACILSSMLIIGLYFVGKAPWFGDFAVMFSVVLIPFLIVNGFLTGMFTEDPVVWYNSEHIMGFRIGTIPLEDIYYNLCLLLPIVVIYEWLKTRFKLQ
ncbi:MAG: lycopene cyclase domain-containing protein [Bacteroidota bacterium]